MNRKVVGAAMLGAVAVVAVVAAATLLSYSPVPPDYVMFHVTLASPEMYKNGTYSEDIDLDAGEYRFRFVPNGDSPRVLSISLSGDNFDFFEDFELAGTRHETGISEYYTWEYAGQDAFTAPDGSATIKIDPNGNLLGPVSVSIVLVQVPA